MPVAIVGRRADRHRLRGRAGRRGVAAVCYEKGVDPRLHLSTSRRRCAGFRPATSSTSPASRSRRRSAHPTRLETLAYYRGVAERFGVRVVAETTIESIRSARRRPPERFRERRTGPLAFEAPAAILATGFFHNPRRLGVPGEGLAARPLALRLGLSLPRPGRRRRGRQEFRGRGRARSLPPRSAGHARRPRAGRSPSGSSTGSSPTSRTASPPARSGRSSSSRSWRSRPRLRPDRDARGEESVRADAVFPLIGYEPDFALFERCGIRRRRARRACRSTTRETLESNVPNLYLAGAMLGGAELGRIFIENSRHHAASSPRRSPRKGLPGGGLALGRSATFRPPAVFQERRRAS